MMLMEISLTFFFFSSNIQATSALDTSKVLQPSKTFNISFNLDSFGVLLMMKHKNIISKWALGSKDQVRV